MQGNNIIESQKYNWISDSKQRRLKKKQKDLDEMSIIMQESRKNLELKVNNMILYEG